MLQQTTYLRNEPLTALSLDFNEINAFIDFHDSVDSFKNLLK